MKPSYDDEMEAWCATPCACGARRDAHDDKRDGRHDGGHVPSGCLGFEASTDAPPTKAERELLMNDDEGDEHPCPDCGSFDCFCVEAETAPEPMDDAGLPGR